MAKDKTIQEQYQELSKSGKKVKVKFVKSPTGVLKLGYNIGEVASVSKEEADFLFDLGLAEKATATKRKKAGTKPKTQNPPKTTTDPADQDPADQDPADQDPGDEDPQE